MNEAAAIFLLHLLPVALGLVCFWSECHEMSFKSYEIFWSGVNLSLSKMFVWFGMKGFETQHDLARFNIVP